MAKSLEKQMVWDEIDNFIIYWTSNDKEREQMRNVLGMYMNEAYDND